MRYALAKAILALGLLGMPLTASATGGLDCAIHDGNLDFQYEALFSYSGIGPLFQSKAEFLSKTPKTHPSLKSMDAERFRLIQQWFEGKDLRLQFYAETQGDGVPFAAVKLTIVTTADEDEISYNGRYTLAVTPAVQEGAETETVKLEGAVACSAG